MGRYEELYKRVCNFAKGDNHVKAMVLFGSRVRTKKPSDEFSDYDLIFFVDDVEYFIHTDEWLRTIGDYKISFVEHTAVQDYERRVFFEDAMDMDFIFYNAADAERITGDAIIQSWYDRGYQVVVDKMGYENLVNEIKLTRISEETVSGELATPYSMSESEFNNLVQTFWFHAIWSVKKLMRGEIWSAKNCIDGYMKNMYREMLECEMKVINGADFDTWHDGRFIDSWLSDEIISKLEASYGLYDRKTLMKALVGTMKIFAESARRAAELIGYNYPAEAELYAFEMVERFDVER